MSNVKHLIYSNELGQFIAIQKDLGILRSSNGYQWDEVTDRETLIELHKHVAVIQYQLAQERKSWWVRIKELFK